LPSAHDEPSGTKVFWHPTSGSQLSVVHVLSSSQFSGDPAVHTPLWQVSSPLQRLPSAHDEPSGTGVFWHPTSGSQLSVVHALSSSQVSGAPAAHTPLWHVSSPSQGLLSAQDEPSGSAAFPQTPKVHTSLVHGLPSAQSPSTAQESQPGIGAFSQPLIGAHVSVVQASASSQSSAVPEVQTPPWQVSLPLQTSPSAHAVPFGTGVLEQPKTGPQPSVVHALPSSQSSVIPEVQTPPWQVSWPLQTSPSAHGVPSATDTFVHPKTGSHVSVVHSLPSLQSSTAPAVQMPLWQVSLPLHTSPSAHEVPCATGVFVHPKMGSQASVVHVLPSLQSSAVPAEQMPLWQVSLPLHSSPSLHEVPFGTAMFLQAATGSQVSVVHTLPSSQSSGRPGEHTPS
jgi:hypothetical protein